MKKNLFSKAVQNNYHIYRNSNDRLIIDGFPGLEIEEQESGRWMIISEQIPQTILDTEDLLAILEKLNKGLKKVPLVS